MYSYCEKGRNFCLYSDLYSLILVAGEGVWEGWLAPPSVASLFPLTSSGFLPIFVSEAGVFPVGWICPIEIDFFGSLASLISRARRLFCLLFQPLEGAGGGKLTFIDLGSCACPSATSTFASSLRCWCDTVLLGVLVAVHGTNCWRYSDCGPLDETGPSDFDRRDPVCPMERATDLPGRPLSVSSLPLLLGCLSNIWWAWYARSGCFLRRQKSDPSIPPADITDP